MQEGGEHGATGASGPPWALEAGVYLLISLGAISMGFGSPDRLVGDGVDLYGTLWFYWWIADCVEHLRDPGFTDLFFHPFGKDVFAHTGNNFVDALLAVPLQWLLGNPGYYRIWVAVLILGNALTFRVLARSVIRDRWAAFAATALWTANPYLAFELTTGRATQAFAWFLPLSLWALFRADRSWRWAVGAGLLLALVGYSYWFYAYFVCFAAAWLVGIELVRRPDRRRVVGGAVLAAAVAALAVLPAVLSMADRVGEGTVDLVAGTTSEGVGVQLHGYLLTEPRGPRFFHHPAWGIALLGWLFLGRGRLRWGGVLVLGLLLATGPTQEIAGQPRELWHYTALWRWLPFFHRLWFPYRALILCFLAVSLGVGLTLERLGGRGPRARLAAGALGGALLVGTLATERLDHTWPLVVRDVPLPRAYDWMASQGGAIVDLPPGITQTSIVHQTRHGLPLFEGMGAGAVFFWPPGHAERLRHPLVRSLARASRRPHRTLEAGGDPSSLLDQGFRWVLLHRELVDSELNRYLHGVEPELRERAPFLATRNLVDLLGDPLAVEGPLVVWALDEAAPPPSDLAPTEATLWTRSWDRPEPAPYEARLYELGRMGPPR